MNFSSVMQLALQSEELLVEDVVYPTFRGDGLLLPTERKQYEGYAYTSAWIARSCMYVRCSLKVL